MSPAPIDRLRELYDRWAQGDFSTTGELLSPDVEWHQSQRAIEPGVRHGHEGATHIARRLFEAFEDFRVEAEEWVDLGDRVIVVAMTSGRSKGAGLPVDRRLTALWTFAGDRAVRVEWYDSRAEAEAAVP